ncbi:MFS transporter [Streptomyces antibioticus]|uniref:MFS transporter n=1 Tax=Streptomyces antibioticus TaxID=1890 RepID=UPI003722C89A
MRRSSPPLSAPPSPPPPLRSRTGAMVGFMVLLELAGGIDQGMFPTLLPTIGEHYGVGAGALVWVSAVPLLGAAVSVPVLAGLGDRYGHRRMLRIATTCTLVASILLVVAPTYELFLVGRLLLAPMAAWLPLEIALVSDRLTGLGARRAIGLLAGSLALGVALGGLVGGYVQDLTGRLPLTLLFPAVLIALCCPVTLWLLPESRTTRPARRIDTLGFAGIGLGLLLLQFGLMAAQAKGWGSALTVGSLALSAAVLVAWGRWELRTPEPAIDLRMLARRGMWPVQLGAVLFGMALFGNQSTLTTFLGARPDTAGYGLGLGALAIGWVTLPSAVAAMAAAALNGRVSARIGPHHTLALGGVLVAAGFLALTLMHDDRTGVVVSTTVFGLGFGLLLAAMPALVAETAPPGTTATAAGVYNSVRVLGGLVAAGAFSVLLAGMVTARSAVPTERAYEVIWVVCAVLGVLVAVLTTATRRRTEDVSS